MNEQALQHDASVCQPIHHKSLYSCQLLQCQSRQLMHCNTLIQDNDSTVLGDGGGRVGEVRAGATSPMPEHKGFKLQ